MFALYLITDDAAPAVLLDKVADALAEAPAGQVCVQLRVKQRSARDQYELGRKLLALCRGRGALLLVNDRVDVALSLGADGVHLPEEGLPLTATRQLLGAKAWIGVSCHDALGLERAATDGANFATLSPVFVSPGKGEPLGLARFEAMTRAARLPVYALGGIRHAQTPQLRAAGATGVAVISAVLQAASPRTAVREFLSCF
ncbi:MAG: hypothetical protein RL701_3990 [Pseudomonadota bacterium]|jgi:thiamine-phosphate pyrophosphorylase